MTFGPFGNCVGDIQIINGHVELSCKSTFTRIIRSFFQVIALRTCDDYIMRFMRVIPVLAVYNAVQGRTV